jgi:hypothetical protein
MAIERDGDEAARARCYRNAMDPRHYLATFDGLWRLKRLSGIYLPQYANMDLMLLTVKTYAADGWFVVYSRDPGLAEFDDHGELTEIHCGGAFAWAPTAEDRELIAADLRPPGHTDHRPIKFARARHLDCDTHRL